MKFFVYGTLKVGGHFAANFDHLRKSSTVATLNNHALYNLGWFPSISPEEGSFVVGELHEYSDEDRVLRAFDMIEGYRGNPDTDLYERRIAEVMTEAGEVHEAVMYIFARKLPPNAKKIGSGIWELGGVRA